MLQEGGKGGGETGLKGCSTREGKEKSSLGSRDAPGGMLQGVGKGGGKPGLKGCSRRDAPGGMERRRRAQASGILQEGGKEEDELRLLPQAVQDESGRIHGAESRSHIHCSRALAARQPTGKSERARILIVLKPQTSPSASCYN